MRNLILAVAVLAMIALSAGDVQAQRYSYGRGFSSFSGGFGGGSFRGGSYYSGRNFSNFGSGRSSFGRSYSGRSYSPYKSYYRGGGGFSGGRSRYGGFGY